MIFHAVHGTLDDQAYRIALALASGKTSKGRTCRNGLIMYADGILSAEFIANGLYELREGKPFPKNLKIIPAREKSYTLADVAKWMNGDIYDLLIVDPLWAFLPPECEDDAKAMHDVLMNVKKIQEATGTAVIGVCHRGTEIRPDDYPKALLRKSGVIGRAFDYVIEIEGCTADQEHAEREEGRMNYWKH